MIFYVQQLIKSQPIVVWYLQFILTIFIQVSILTVIFKLIIHLARYNQFIMKPEGVLGWFAFRRWLLFQGIGRIKIFFRLIGLILLALGVGSLIIMLNGLQTQKIYSVSSQCVTKSTNVRCEQTFQIQKLMKAPIYMFYYIENIYINHRKYLLSFSPEQLKGETIDAQKAEKQCIPIVYNKDLPFTTSWGGVPLDPEQIASPCGLKAMLFFNDTYRLYNSKSQQIPINVKGVSLDLNNQKAFKKQVESEKKQWINPEDQHFINWMQNSALMTKKKLWGKIDTDLPPGQYKVLVQNNYKMNKMKIGKGIQLSTSSIVGGHLFFVPIALIVLGISAWLYTFFISYKFGDSEDLLTSYRDKK